MRQRVLLDFRTPQHPSLGTNNWGGSSPLLARNIPKESLEHRYLKLNTIRDDDENFQRTTIEDEIFSFQGTTIEQEIFKTRKTEATKYECPPTPRRGGRLFQKLMDSRAACVARHRQMCDYYMATTHWTSVGQQKWPDHIIEILNIWERLHD